MQKQTKEAEKQVMQQCIENENQRRERSDSVEPKSSHDHMSNDGSTQMKDAGMTQEETTQDHESNSQEVVKKQTQVNDDTNSHTPEPNSQDATNDLNTTKDAHPEATAEEPVGSPVPEEANHDEDDQMEQDNELVVETEEDTVIY